MYSKKIFALGIPLLAGNVSHYLYHLADTAMVGRLGNEPLAAIAVASLFTGILFVLVWPVSLGSQAIASRRFGRQEEDPAGAEFTGRVLDNTMIVGLIAGFIAFAGAWAGRPLFRLLLDDSGIIENADIYVKMSRWGIPFVGISMAVRGFLAGTHRTKTIMISNISSNLLNIFFNYIFIFGKFGFPAMGIKGAALGTVLAEIFAACYMASALLNKEELKKYRYLTFRSLKGSTMKDVAVIAYPVAIQNGVALAVILAYEAMVGRLGIVYLAVTHIVFSMFRINKTIAGGFAQGSSILVGNFLGRGEKKEAERVVLSCQIIAGIIGLLIFAAVMIFPETLIRLFTREPESLTLGVQAFRFFAVFFFIEILGYSFEIIFTNNGWGKFVLFSEFTTNMLFILGASFLLTRVFSFGIKAAWLSFALYQVFHAGILLTGYISGRWAKIEVDGEAVSSEGSF